MNFTGYFAGITADPDFRTLLFCALSFIGATVYACYLVLRPSRRAQVLATHNLRSFLTKEQITFMTSLLNFVFRVGAAVSIFAAICVLAAAAHADTIYTYDGPDLTACNSSTCAQSADYLQITLDYSTPLGPNFTQTQTSPVSWSIDVVNGDTAAVLINLSNTTANLYSGSPNTADGTPNFDFITDASGNITGWSISAGTGNGNVVASIFSDGFAGNFGVTGQANNNIDAVGGPGNFGITVPGVNRITLLNESVANGGQSPANWIIADSGGNLAPVPEPTLPAAATLLVFAAWRLTRRRRPAPGAATPRPPELIGA